uniref:Uncharacterized protein n=1 Tax=Romanomermis culicivorax TaxID=13658 RepID=A0A915KS87_ROMCU
MADKLLDQPMLTAPPKPSDDELLETVIFDLNIAKTSATGPPAVANLTVSVTSINEFLKFILDDIFSLAPVSEEMTTLAHQTEMDTETDATATTDQTLTNIPEETTTDNETAMDMWAALATALKAYNFPPPGMVFPEQHWHD